MSIRLALFLVVAISYVCCVSANANGFCSQVHQMNEYCSDSTLESTLTSQQNQGRTGKSGPQGPPGPPGTVDYNAIKNIVAQNFPDVLKSSLRDLRNELLPTVDQAELEEKVQARIDELESRIVNQDGKPTLVDLSPVQKAIEKQFQELRLELTQEFNNKLEELANDKAQFDNAIGEFQRRKKITDCSEVSAEDVKICNGTGGLYDIYRGSKLYEVYCDTTTDGGGWTVFQRRMDGSVDFDRGWDDYVNGFGNKTGEFWMGLQEMYELMKGYVTEMRIEITDHNGFFRIATYRYFFLEGPSTGYRMLYLGYFGDAGDGLDQSKDMAFTTKDRDQDKHSANCAQLWKGGWWFNNCGRSNLNGKYSKTPKVENYRGIYWYNWGGAPYSHAKTEMKFRRKP